MVLKPILNSVVITKKFENLKILRRISAAIVALELRFDAVGLLFVDKGDGQVFRRQSANN